MGRDFDTRREREVRATPEEVWDAIATGPGIDSWFMGRNRVEPGPGGSVTTAFAGYEPEHEITAWEPGRRLAYRSETEDDGRYIGYEFLIEGREGSTTVVRLVTSGFLPDDDWEDEFEAMTKGGDLFFATLVEYLGHFSGRTARPVTAFGPPVADWDEAWARLGCAVGIEPPVGAEAPVRFVVDGLEPIDGEVYFANDQTLGIRTSDAMYRFLQGFRGPMVASHHLFSVDADASRVTSAFETWLDRLLTEH